MSNKISISAADLNDQSLAMESLAADYNDILLKLTSVGIHLATSINEKRVKKILDELDNIYKITTKGYDSLMGGAKIARTAAETFTNVDTQLRKAVDNGELDLDKSAYENIAVSAQTVNNRGDISTDFGKSHENAEKRGITYYVQTKKYNSHYNAANWISGGKNYEYKAGVGCGVSCDAMMLSSLGVTGPNGKEYTPGDLVAKNGGSAAHDGGGVNKVLEQNGLAPETYGSAGHSAQQMQDRLDQCLENYAKDPDKYSPPMVCIDMMKDGSKHNHYVLVVGKDKDGYICVDPNLNGRSTFRVGTKVSTNDTTYTSYIKFIKTFTRK